MKRVRSVELFSTAPPTFTEDLVCTWEVPTNALVHALRSSSGMFLSSATTSLLIIDWICSSVHTSYGDPIPEASLCSAQRLTAPWLSLCVSISDSWGMNLNGWARPGVDLEVEEGARSPGSVGEQMVTGEFTMQWGPCLIQPMLLWKCFASWIWIHFKRLYFKIISDRERSCQNTKNSYIA